MPQANATELTDIFFDAYRWRQSLESAMKKSPDIPDDDGSDTMAGFEFKRDINEAKRRIQMAIRDYLDPHMAELEDIYGEV